MGDDGDRAMESGPSGLPCAGSLAVLVDNALGYAMIAELPKGCWSVSAEISIELCAAIPIDGSLLRAEPASCRPTHS